MDNFGLNEMFEMQKSMQEKYKNIWNGISAETGKNQLLWMIGEIGEVIDIIKKNGGEKASKDPNIRKDLVEELVDVAMYFNDVLLCYEISAQEFKEAYIAKYEKNMKRW